MKHKPDLIRGASTTSELLQKIGVSSNAKKKKRGRPRKEGVERYASGQIKHSERQREVREVAMLQRAKVFGLSAADTLDQRAGSPLGRLHMRGFVTEHQASAGELYLKNRTALRAAEGFSSPFARGANIWDNAGGNNSSKAVLPVLEETWDRVDFIDRSRRNMEQLKDHVAKRGGAEAAGWLTGLDAFLDDAIDEKQLLQHPRALHCIRGVLNLLADFYRIGPRRRS